MNIVDFPDSVFTVPATLKYRISLMDKSLHVHLNNGFIVQPGARFSAGGLFYCMGIFDGLFLSLIKAPVVASL